MIPQKKFIIVGLVEMNYRKQRKKCIDSWEKNIFPEYEIIQWNEDNYDVRKNNYIREAYE